ncbi:VTT domain-containing protein [uncultured Vibrio sp.]|uniref:DedA family protein n=1 Tax=uncultured Vibrio sp. TaxID=114054 RepID=UPI0025E6A3FE|nr:VTT domain-containing protein [uncultured Vibrio sp.]
MQEMLAAVWHQDFDSLQQISSLKWFLLVLALILFLESGFVFLPFPGDSLVLFVGGMIGLSVFGFYPALLLLSLAASLGSLCAYFQGRFLHKTRFVGFLERILPDDSLPKAKALLDEYGFLSLFISRFIPFVRVLTPMLMGVSKLSVWRTMIISISSSVIWCLVLLLIGKMVMTNPLMAEYQELLTRSTLMVSFALMVFAVIGIVYRVIKSRQEVISD